jgi:hypothetical protein
MLRDDTRPDHDLLVRVLRDPDELLRLSASQFSRVLDAAEDARLLGWLITHAAERDAPRDAPPWLQDRLTSAGALVGEYDRSVRWEIDRLARAFYGSDVPWVLLKGAAYLAAALPPGRGRRVADVDILVPEARLGETERLLQAHGWRFGALDPYDERYYREWMHELPPMSHVDREAVVDVHHTILPRTGRLHPSAARLVNQAVEVDGDARVLSPAHMMLHAAAHLFHDGEIAGAIRDLADLDGLIRVFSRRADFWTDLEREAAELELQRPAYYALRYARRMFGTPIPAEVLERVRAWAPPATVERIMDLLVARSIPGPSGQTSRASAFLLYVRAHWLRMPPGLLVRHLTRKALRRDAGAH